MKNEPIYLKRKQPIDAFLGIVAVVFSGLLLPFILVPIVRLTGFSEIIEEICKATIVLFLVLGFYSIKQKVGAGIIFGFLFGMSESLLYLNNIFQVGDFSIFWQRFLLAVPMHIVTVLIILFAGLKSKIYIVLGLIGAIVIHLLFNYLMVSS